MKTKRFFFPLFTLALLALFLLPGCGGPVSQLPDEKTVAFQADVPGHEGIALLVTRSQGEYAVYATESGSSETPTVLDLRFATPKDMAYDNYWILNIVASSDMNSITELYVQFLKDNVSTYRLYEVDLSGLNPADLSQKPKNGWPTLQLADREVSSEEVADAAERYSVRSEDETEPESSVPEDGND